MAQAKGRYSLSQLNRGIVAYLNWQEVAGNCSWSHRLQARRLSEHLSSRLKSCDLLRLQLSDVREPSVAAEQRALFDVQPDPWDLDDMQEQLVATVVFAEGAPGEFDYSIPETLVDEVCVGKRVRVPLGRGNRSTVAYCVVVERKKTNRPLKSVQSVLDRDALISPKMLELDALDCRRVSVFVWQSARDRRTCGCSRPSRNLRGHVSFGQHARCRQNDATQTAAQTVRDHSSVSVVADASIAVEVTGTRWLHIGSVESVDRQATGRGREASRRADGIWKMRCRTRPRTSSSTKTSSVR